RRSRPRLARVRSRSTGPPPRPRRYARRGPRRMRSCPPDTRRPNAVRRTPAASCARRRPARSRRATEARPCFAHSLLRAQRRVRRARRSSSSPVYPARLVWRLNSNGLDSIMARILLAEDDNSLRGFLTRALERADHEVVACENGDDAIDALDQGPYDLLLTDIVMPGADGIEVARVAAARQPGLRIMFITGFAAVALSAAQA